MEKITVEQWNKMWDNEKMLFCQYGDLSNIINDIWDNLSWPFKETCINFQKLDKTIINKIFEDWLYLDLRVKNAAIKNIDFLPIIKQNVGFLINLLCIDKQTDEIYPVGTKKFEDCVFLEEIKDTKFIILWYDNKIASTGLYKIELFLLLNMLAITRRIS